jgi:hypothetical protein
MFFPDSEKEIFQINPVPPFPQANVAPMIFIFGVIPVYKFLLIGHHFHEKSDSENRPPESVPPIDRGIRNFGVQKKYGEGNGPYYNRL